MRSVTAIVLAALGASGCAMHGPIIADVRCPQNTKLIRAGESGHCALPDGTKHGPSYAVSDHGVKIDGYDHGVLAGPYAHYAANGKRTAHGYRPGVTDSTAPSTTLGQAEFDSPLTTGKLIYPERVRLAPVQGDVGFSASTLVSSTGRPTSSFIGATVDLLTPTRTRLHFRTDAYRAYYVSYGVQGAFGAVSRAECDDPVIAGSGGFCGSRWMVGGDIHVGYARTSHARANGAVPTLLAYGKVGFLLGQDRWSSTYSTSSALVWRARLGAGYTALGSVLGLARQARASTSDGWRYLLIPFVALVEHAEAYVDLGADGTAALGVGAGIDVGFGL